MFKWLRRDQGADHTFLGRLRRDASGNTLAMMAIALIPMTALAGSAIDTARLYVVKVRLQQACDAGALAGRKFMASTDSSTLDDNAKAQALAFFNNNFRSGWFQTNTVTFTPSKTADKQVAAVASATVPMTIARFLGKTEVPLSVACQARFDVADVDVMFVLDTTGSMACLASDSETTCNNYAGSLSNQTTKGSIRYVVEKSGSRIDAVRKAVRKFYDTLKAAADPSTHLRYGFVPYSTTVNVGRIIPSSYLATTAQYQTREVAGDAVSATSTSSTSDTTASSCSPTGPVRSPATGYSTSATATRTTKKYTANTSGNTSKGTCETTTQTLVPNWRYLSKDLDTSTFITGADTTLPTMVTGATDTWEGCIEERKSDNVASFNQSSLPKDLDPDLTPSSSDPDSLWRPMWFDVEYDRKASGSETSASQTRAPSDRYNGNNISTTLALQYNAIACPKQARRLVEMTGEEVDDYVKSSNDFLPYGATYHDIGMTWGLRFLAPNGPFRADTAAWPGRNAPNRYIVFLTDGDMAPNQIAYAAHGLEKFDKRVTADGSTDLEARHNARFLAECQAAKDRNITVFVVAYAQTMTTQLTNCASPNKAFYASDDVTLNAQFQKIAQQIALLRLSK